MRERAVTTTLFTPEQIAEDGRNRVGRTAGQGGVALSIVTVGEWLSQQLGWHGHLPTSVSGSLVVLLTAGAAFYTNRNRLRGIG